MGDLFNNLFGGGLTIGTILLALLVAAALEGLAIGIVKFYQVRNLRGQERPGESVVVGRVKAAFFISSLFVLLLFIIVIVGLASS